MRISILMASLAVALMTITTARSAPSADPARVLRSITPWAPPEWHPNREALDVPSGFEGHAEKRVPGLDSRAAFVYDVDADQVLFDFAVSEDEQSLLLVRGPRIRDAHLMTGF